MRPLWERGRNRWDVLRIQLNSSGTGQLPTAVAKFPWHGRRSPADLPGSRPPLHRYRKMMVCGGEDFPLSTVHQPHNYSHWGVSGRKLPIWAVLTLDPGCCTGDRVGDRCPNPRLTRLNRFTYPALGLAQTRQTATVTTVYPHRLQTCKINK